MDLFDDKKSEKWRLECEARFSLSMPLKARRLYLADVHEKRGKLARIELEAEITKQWIEQKQTKV